MSASTVRGGAVAETGRIPDQEREGRQPLGKNAEWAKWGEVSEALKIIDFIRAYSIAHLFSPNFGAILKFQEIS